MANNAIISNSSTEIVSRQQLAAESVDRLSYPPEVCTHCETQTDLSWKNYLKHNLEPLEFNLSNPEPELLSDQGRGFNFLQGMNLPENQIPPFGEGDDSLLAVLDVEFNSSEPDAEFLENQFPKSEPPGDVNNSTLAIISPEVPHNSPVVNDADDTSHTFIRESNHFDIRKSARSEQVELTAGVTAEFETPLQDPQHKFDKIQRPFTREITTLIQQDKQEANLEPSIDLFQKTDQIKMHEMFSNDRPSVFTNSDSDAGTHNLFRNDGTLTLNHSKGVYSNPKLDVSHFQNSSVVDQVIEVFSPHFLRIAANGTREINIKIYPEELGTLSISVFQTQRELRANIVANEWLTTEILFRDKTFLMDLLKEKGLDLADINISHRDSKGDSSSRHQNNHETVNHRFDLSIPLPSTLTAQLLGSHLSRSLGGIDLIV